ncbi:hypothetical protein GQ53DRAFT_852870 [Thozetella sp. PMI_491]|nr:hypothetical protein GQ53DRAFT_852870 [Thozetella sp. PMI_491]
MTGQDLCLFLPLPFCGQVRGLAEGSEAARTITAAPPLVTAVVVQDAPQTQAFSARLPGAVQPTTGGSIRSSLGHTFRAPNAVAPQEASSPGFASTPRLSGLKQRAHKLAGARGAVSATGRHWTTPGPWSFLASAVELPTVSCLSEGHFGPNAGIALSADGGRSTATIDGGDVSPTGLVALANALAARDESVVSPLWETSDGV